MVKTAFLRAERRPPELSLAYEPGMVHQTLSSRVHWRETLAECLVASHRTNRGNTRSAWPTRSIGPRPTAYMPATLAASTPAWASSKTTHSFTHTQQAGSIDEQVWCRLGPHHTVAVGHGIDAGRDLQPLHDLTGVLAGRANGDFHTGRA